MRLRRLSALPWLLPIVMVSAACMSGPRNSSATTTTAGGASGSATSTTTRTPSTAPTPTTVSTRPGAVNLAVPAEVDPQLLEAYVSGARNEFGGDADLRAPDVIGPLSGNLYYAEIPSTGDYWALASFSPSAQATPQQQVNFQDGGGTGLFEEQPGQGWKMVGHPNGGGPWPCPGQILPALEDVWHLQSFSGCPASTVPSAVVSRGGDTVTIRPGGHVTMIGRGCPPGGVAAAAFENSNHGTSDPVYGRADTTGAYAITITLPETTYLPYSVSAYCQGDVAQIDTVVWFAHN